MSIRVLFLGEIVGRAGIQVIKKGMPRIKAELSPDYIIANGEGMTNGFGLGKAHAMQLTKMGVNLITGGEKLFFKLDMVDFLPKAGFILRPANFPSETPGRGIRYTTIKNKKIAIINLIGGSGFLRISVQNPFQAIGGILDHVKTECDIVLLQFHASPTAEKATMGYFLDGKVQAVISTHTKALTSDARILPGGTAFISDNGRCGALQSVGGFDPSPEIQKFMTGLPLRSHESWNDGHLQGALVEINEETCKTEHIITLDMPIALDVPEEKK